MNFKFHGARDTFCTSYSHIDRFILIVVFWPIYSSGSVMVRMGNIDHCMGLVCKKPDKAATNFYCEIRGLITWITGGNIN